jgi:hypothetical protein
MQCTNPELPAADSTRRPNEVGAAACPPIRPQAGLFYAAVGLRLAALSLTRIAAEAAHRTLSLTVAESAAPATQAS